MSSSSVHVKVSSLEPGISAFSIRQKLGAYVQLTKPRIVLLFAVTGLASMIIQGSLLLDTPRMWMIFWGMVLCAGSANAFNQYLDRDIDYLMERTRKKRPLPQGILTPNRAFTFAVVTGIISTWILYAYGSALAAFFGVATIFYYVCIYTMWLKRKTPYNIVIGGAAGATAPLIGWAAATGTVSVGAWISFLIIFMWTPPHFWALSLVVKDEYKKASVPMLPVVKGEEVTRRQILIYTLLLVPITLLLYFIKDCGWIYLVTASLLGLEFIRRSFQLYRKKEISFAWKTFGFSIVYLLLLYVVMIADHLVLAAEKIPLPLEGVGIQEKLGQSVDLGLEFKDEQGQVKKLSDVVNGKKPVLLFLAYYGCPNLCNFFLNGALDSLKKLSWTVGKEFEILTISIDTSEKSQLASQKKATFMKEYQRAEAQQGWHFWVNNTVLGPTDPNYRATSVAKLADQVGFQYRYNKDEGQFAHSAGMMVLTPEGKISRYLFGIEFKQQDLRLALTEAGGGKIGNLVDHFLLFCYNYDPKARSYSLYAMNLMKIGALLTVLILFASIMSMRRRGKKQEFIEASERKEL